MKIELLISIAGGLAATSKWIYEYSNKLKWEKNKFLLEQIEKFESLESTQFVQKCLDWNSITISHNGEMLKINDEDLLNSLQTHNKKHKFTPDEVLLRKMFDDYFDNLTRLVLLSKTKLISEDNLILFLEYWFEILSGNKKNKDKKIIEQIHNYMSFYGYKTLLEFILKI